MTSNSLAPQVVLTDVHRVLPLLRRNVALATVGAQGPAPHVRPLPWGAAAAEPFVAQEGGS